jgi:hypothetical protein
MQIPATGQPPMSIPVIKDFLTMISALGLGIAFFVGVCWGLTYTLTLILEHATSTQMLFMCLIGFGLIHVARRYLQRAKK